MKQIKRNERERGMRIKFEIGKKAEGAEEGITLLAAMIAFAAIGLFIFSFAAVDKSRQSYEDKFIGDVQDPQRFMNSFWSIKITGGTMYDLFMKSYLQGDYAEFGEEADAAMKKYYSDDACLEIYVEDEKVYSTNILRSCKAKITSEMKMPVYSNDIAMRLIAG